MNATKKIAALSLVGVMALGLGACSDGGNDQFAKREQQQAAKKNVARDTLEKQNLKERMRRQERPTALGYVYLVNFGKPFGYYAIKGKVSSSGSQLTPEQDVIRDRGQYGGGNVVTDGPQDDGTYGNGDPGIFFFTTDGVMVETSMDYIYSDKPMAIDVPLLGGSR
jgi:hypothetical protein